jgi:hypothetical protein
MPMSSLYRGGILNIDSVGCLYTEACLYSFAIIFGFNLIDKLIALRHMNPEFNILSVTGQAFSAYGSLINGLDAFQEIGLRPQSVGDN